MNSVHEPGSRTMSKNRLRNNTESIRIENRPSAPSAQPIASPRAQAERPAPRPPAPRAPALSAPCLLPPAPHARAPSCLQRWPARPTQARLRAPRAHCELSCAPSACPAYAQPSACAPCRCYSGCIAIQHCPASVTIQ